MSLIAGLLVAAGFVVARSFPNKVSLQTRLVNASRVAVRLSLNEELRLGTSFSDEPETSIEPLPAGKSYSCILSSGPEGDLIAEKISVLPQ
jgi:hypothetical protein